MNIVLIVGLDLSDEVYITYNMGNRDLPDIYAHALGPAALGLGHIYIRQIPLAHVITYTYKLCLMSYYLPCHMYPLVHPCLTVLIIQHLCCSRCLSELDIVYIDQNIEHPLQQLCLMPVE